MEGEKESNYNLVFQMRLAKPKILGDKMWFK